MQSDTGKIEKGLTFHIPWWQFSDEDGQCLIELAETVNAKVIYEIGCWTGHSTSYLAEVAKKNKGIVTVIDTFEGTGIMKSAIESNFNPRIEFEKNMDILGIRDYIKVLHGKASTFVPRVHKESIDFMFIDGDHRYSQVTKDINAWWPKIRKGGILCGHDCESSEWDEDKVEIEEGVDGVHHGVVKAVFKRFLNVEIEHKRIWWVKK